MRERASERQREKERKKERKKAMELIEIGRHV